MSHMLQCWTNNQEVLQVTMHIVTGGGQTEATFVGGPESAEHLCSVSSTDHSCQNGTLSTLIAVSSSAGPDWVWLAEGGFEWVKVS